MENSERHEPSTDANDELIYDGDEPGGGLHGDNLADDQNVEQDQDESYWEDEYETHDKYLERRAERLLKLKKSLASVAIAAVLLTGTVYGVKILKNTEEKTVGVAPKNKYSISENETDEQISARTNAYTEEISSSELERQNATHRIEMIENDIERENDLVEYLDRVIEGRTNGLYEREINDLGGTADYYNQKKQMALERIAELEKQIEDLTPITEGI